MSEQLDIFQVHAIQMKAHLYENNPESQETLEINRRSFEGQNRRLFELLMRGERLTFSDAFIKHGITDIRRRAKDLTDMMGVLISKEFIEGTRNKIWYMDFEQREYNKQRLKLAA